MPNGKLDKKVIECDFNITEQFKKSNTGRMIILKIRLDTFLSDDLINEAEDNILFDVYIKLNENQKEIYKRTDSNGRFYWSMYPIYYEIYDKDNDYVAAAIDMYREGDYLIMHHCIILMDKFEKLH